MVFGQFTPYKITDSGTTESEKHFHRTATQEKGKCATGKCSCKSECDRGIQTVDPLNFIQVRMELLSGKIFFFCWKIIDKVL